MCSLFGTQPVAEKKVDAPTAPTTLGQIGAVPTAPQQKGEAPAATTAQATSAPQPAVVPSAERVRIETDMVRAEIDPIGAALVHAELLKQVVAPDWTASGIVGLFTGKKQDREQHIVLFEWNKNRVYLARTGLIGP